MTTQNTASMKTQNEITQTNSKRAWRVFAGIALLCVLAGIADLQFRGLAWQFIYRQTGETEVIAQVRGLLELGGNLIRPALDTRPLVPIDQRQHAPFGINTFLQKEVEEPKIRVMLQMIQDAGFTWLRQEFPWEDLEVDGRGQFTDTRNDFNGDGVRDTIDAWAKYDRMVALTEAYGLQMLVRLSNPPEWAQAQGAGNFAPPSDLQDYVNYAVAVAERYKGRLRYYQIWNEPNIYPEWGENFADPRAYTEMLCRTYQALKAVDPEIVVVSAAIAPTISLDGFKGYQDIVYLQNMYDAGAGACFDVMAAQGYGLFSGAYDRRLRATSVTVARHTYYRDIMVANGDAHKPIWISEAAWNPVLDAALPREQIADFSRFGESTLQEAAENMPLLYQRAQEEWSWVGGVFYWFFTRPDPSENGQSFFYFRMVEPDYQPDKPSFTPLPVYESVKTYISTLQPTLYRGTHQAEHWAITRTDAHEQTLAGAQFGRAERLRDATFDIVGTDLRLRWHASSAPFEVYLDGQLIAEIQPADARLIQRDGWRDLGAGVLWQTDDGWQSARVLSTRTAQRHRLQVSLPRSAPADAFMVLDSVQVNDKTWDNLAPLGFVLAGLGIFSVGVLLVGLWRRLAREER